MQVLHCRDGTSGGLVTENNLEVEVVHGCVTGCKQFYPEYVLLQLVVLQWLCERSCKTTNEFTD